MPAYAEFVLFLSLSPKELDPSFDVHTHTHTHTQTHTHTPLLQGFCGSNSHY